MTGLKERLQDDLRTAMKARDEVRTRTLRMVLTAITNEEVAGDQSRRLSDDDIDRLLLREAKKRRESAEAFEQGGRTERAQAERAEGEILREYLPDQLDDAELGTLIDAAITETGATGMRSMGQVMKTVTPRVAGRADEDDRTRGGGEASGTRWHSALYACRFLGFAAQPTDDGRGVGRSRRHAARTGTGGRRTGHHR